MSKWLDIAKVDASVYREAPSKEVALECFVSLAGHIQQGCGFGPDERNPRRLLVRRPQGSRALRFRFENPTPFNGQHAAGPNALISIPNAKTSLGPLCTVPIKQGGTYVCNINQ